MEPQVGLFVFLLSVLVATSFSRLSENSTRDPHGLFNMTDEDLELRISQGKDAKDGQFPFMVFLERSKHTDNYMRCSGFIISKFEVLTAAHCVVVNDYKVSVSDLVGYAGSVYPNRGKVLRFCHVAVHPKYKQVGIDDIAVLRTDKPIPFSPIPYKPFNPSIHSILPFNPWDFLTTHIGWGYTNCHLPVEPKYPVVLQYSQEIPVYYQIKNNQKYLCHSMRISGVCGGDSGGPMIIKTGKGAFAVGLSSMAYFDDFPNGFSSMYEGCSLLIADYVEFIDQSRLSSDLSCLN